MRKLSTFVGLGLSLLVAVPAMAQEEAPAAPPPVEPAATSLTTGAGLSSPSLVARPLQGAAGQIYIRTLVGVNMSKSAVAKPFSIAPDIFYAVDEKLQLGLVHNSNLGWQSMPGEGLCLSGKENGCEKVWNNFGIDALYSLMTGATDLSAHATLNFARVSDPMFLGVTLGVFGKHRIGDQMAIQFDPGLYIGLNKRDVGNKEFLILPVEFQYQLQERLALVAMTGIWGALDGFGDSFMIPLGVGAFYNVNEMIDVGGRFSFDNLLGKNSSADARSLSLLLNVRL